MASQQYPIGPFEWGQFHSDEAVRSYIHELRTAPVRLRQKVRGLNQEQLDTPYREGGWTIRQVVHHIADASINGYVRMKLALTEDTPAIKPYEQDEWAETSDAAQLSIEPSLHLFDGLMTRWSSLLLGLESASLSRSYYHPEDDAEVTLREAIALYNWHINHHIAHITGAIRNNDWDIPAAPPYITGLGGIFFKSAAPEHLKEWYRDFLGLESDQYGHLFRWREYDQPIQLGHTQWSIFSAEGSYMNPSEKELMINYRVKDLDGLLEHLHHKGAQLIGEPESYEYGRFAWVMDPDGNKIELWEPVDQPFAPE